MDGFRLTLLGNKYFCRDFLLSLPSSDSFASLSYICGCGRRNHIMKRLHGELIYWSRHIMAREKHPS